MFGLWIALTVGLAAIFYLLSRSPRCFIRGCYQAAEVDRLWCHWHADLILEESRRVGQTAASSSARSVGDVPKTHDADGAGVTHLQAPPAYSSSAGLRLTRRPHPHAQGPASGTKSGMGVSARPRPTLADSPAGPAGGHLRLIRPFDQEENP